MKPYKCACTDHTKRKAVAAFARSIGTQTMVRRGGYTGAKITKQLAPGAPRKVWLTYTTSVLCTAVAPGFAYYQFKANDPYRPDPLNAVSPNGWSQYGGIYSYAKVIGARIEAEAFTGAVGFKSLIGCSWGDRNYTPVIGTATATGYTFPDFYINNSVKPKIAGYNEKTTIIRSPFIRTSSVLKSNDESEDATTVAGGGASSPTSLWYFNILTEPLVSIANNVLMKIRLSQLVQFYDANTL